MKIGILTYHRAINYGAVLQSYSLVEHLKKDFPEASIQIIDYNSRSREIFKYKCPLIFTYRRGLLQALKKFHQTMVFNKFIKTLPLSKSLVGKPLKTIVKKISSSYDIVIVGSDAVFNWNDIGIPNVYFLSDVNVKAKLSYAASAHLQRHEDINDSTRNYLKTAFSDFNYLGVRDENTYRFVEKYASDTVPIQHNCDPTILLEMNFSEMNLLKKMKKNKFDFSKKTVFIMLMHPQYSKYVRKYWGEDVQIVALMDGNQNADVYLHDLNPFEWGHVFKYGMFLVTDYFHGTIMGLKNLIPVLSIDTSNYSGASYESKAYDLLHRRLNLPMLYASSSELRETGCYSIFEKRVSQIIKNYSQEEVQAALTGEAQNYNSFIDRLKEVINNNEPQN